MRGTATKNPCRRAGFTIAEVMVALTVAMILLFGTLYSASETVGVVREGDQRLHSEMLARNTLDRMLGDCRYASDIVVTGSLATGWTLAVTTTSGLDPGTLTYAWDPNLDTLAVTSSGSTEVLLEGVTLLDIQTTTVNLSGTPTVSSVAVNLEMESTTPGFTGADEGATGETLELSSTVKVRLGDS